MSKKRFKLWKTFDRDGYTDDWGVIDTSNNDIDYEEYVLDEDEVVDLLNQLSDENRQLKEDNEKWERFANMEFIKGSTEIGRLNKNIVDLKKENEQLKERLYEFEKRKIIEESEIDEDVIPKIKLLRTELFGEKYE